MNLSRTRVRSKAVSGGHEHAGHSHGAGEDADSRRLAGALGLIVAFMATEVAVGILAHSLVLLSDAAHMLTDAGALVMSLVVIRLMKRPAGGNLTFGRLQKKRVPAVIRNRIDATFV